jgi:hypothetical protein
LKIIRLKQLKLRDEIMQVEDATTLQDLENEKMRREITAIKKNKVQ